MNEFVISSETTIEASSAEDAEELFLELLESDPAVISWTIHRQPETAVV